MKGISQLKTYEGFNLDLKYSARLKEAGIAILH